MKIPIPSFKHKKRKLIINFTPLGRLVIIAVAVVIVLAVSIPLIVHVAKDDEPKKIKVKTEKYQKVSDEAEVERELSLEEREELVFELLTKAGISPEGACGIMGSIAIECPSYDPTLIGNNDTTYGLFQWNDVGDRRANLVIWCEEQDIPYDTIESQIAYALYEIDGGDSIACRLKDFLKTTQDTYTAAEEFTAGFERCVGAYSDNELAYTGSLYPEYYKEQYQGMRERVRQAMNYYNRFVKPSTYSINDKDIDVEYDPSVNEEYLENTKDERKAKEMEEKGEQVKEKLANLGLVDAED